MPWNCGGDLSSSSLIITVSRTELKLLDKLNELLYDEEGDEGMGLKGRWQYSHQLEQLLARFEILIPNIYD